MRHAPHDSDIDRCLWLSAHEILTAPNLRSQLVAESIRSYQQDPRYPLSLIGAFNWPLLGCLSRSCVLEYAALKFNVVNIPMSESQK